MAFRSPRPAHPPVSIPDRRSQVLPSKPQPRASRVRTASRAVSPSLFLQLDIDQLGGTARGAFRGLAGSRPPVQFFRHHLPNSLCCTWSRAACPSGTAASTGCRDVQRSGLCRTDRSRFSCRIVIARSLSGTVSTTHRFISFKNTRSCHLN